MKLWWRLLAQLTSDANSGANVPAKVQLPVRNPSLFLYWQTADRLHATSSRHTPSEPSQPLVGSAIVPTIFGSERNSNLCVHLRSAGSDAFDGVATVIPVWQGMAAVSTGIGLPVFGSGTTEALPDQTAPQSMLLGERPTPSCDQPSTMKIRNLSENSVLQTKLCVRGARCTHYPAKPSGTKNADGRSYQAGTEQTNDTTR